MSSWRNPLPLPSWREFLRAGWAAMFNIEKVAEALERIEGHLVVLNDHAEAATLARRQAGKLRQDAGALQLRALSEQQQPIIGQVRVVEESSNFMQLLRVELPCNGGAIVSTGDIAPTGPGAFLVALQGLPASVYVAEMRLGETTVSKGESREIRIDTVPFAQPTRVSLRIVHRPTLENTP